MEAPDPIHDGPAEAPVTVILAHGAGVGHDSPFMSAIAGHLAAAGLHVVRFDFPYMARARREGRRRPPDGRANLLASFRGVVNGVGAPQRCVLAGKSMGGRMASLLARELADAGTPAAGAAALGYPFHPPGKPEQLRIEHLHGLPTPMLICQGERDPFGTPDEVAGYVLPDTIGVQWLTDGDHHLSPRKTSEATQAGNWAAAAGELATFARRVAG